MIHTPITQVLREAGFSPDNFYIHPFDALPSDYIPVWHLAEGRVRSRERVTEVNEHKITKELT